MSLPKIETKTLLGVFVTIFIIQIVFNLFNFFIYTDRSWWQWSISIVGFLLSIIGALAFYDLWKMIPSANSISKSFELSSDADLIKSLEKVKGGNK